MKSLGYLLKTDGFGCGFFAGWYGVCGSGKICCKRVRRKNAKRRSNAGLKKKM